MSSSKSVINDVAASIFCVDECGNALLLVATVSKIFQRLLKDPYFSHSNYFQPQI
jgi:hypothetical protein